MTTDYQKQVREEEKRLERLQAEELKEYLKDQESEDKKV